MSSPMKVGDKPVSKKLPFGGRIAIVSLPDGEVSAIDLSPSKIWPQSGNNPGLSQLSFFPTHKGLQTVCRLGALPFIVFL